MLWIQLFVIQNGAYAQTDTSKTKEIRNKQRVNYVYNFTNYIDWEELPERSRFIIGVLGEDEGDLVAEFKESAKNRTVKGLPVKIKSFTKISEISSVDILYVNSVYGFDLNPILEKLYVSHSLLVTEGYPFRMSMINFIELDNEFHFELNQEKINRAQLLVAPNLLSFSTQSTADWNELYKRLQKEMITVKVQKEKLTKLSDDIDTKNQQLENQKNELILQEKKLNRTLDSIKVQKDLLVAQGGVIRTQNSEINEQLLELGLLSKKIQRQKTENIKMQHIADQQSMGIAEQERVLLKQKGTLMVQQKDIERQEAQIKRQKNTVKLQFTQIQQQKILLITFLAFTLLSLIFAVFMYRSNKKRKQSEAILAAKNIQLSEVNASLDSFTYRVAHDLKAPVTNMKNMIALLKKYVDSTTQPILPELYKNFDLSADRLSTTIAGMLELTKIERIQKNRKSCNLLDIVNSLLVEYQGELNNINATVNLEAMNQSNVFATEAELTSIFQNLITNSIKYRAKNRPLIITIKSEHKGEHCSFSYADNGMGIDLEKYGSKMFSIFERFTTDTAIAGTGIGMHVIKKMVENNAGTINLQSKPDEGLTYFFSIPVSAL